MRRFECTEGDSQKFWEVDVVGTKLRVRFGKLGTDGRLNEKPCPTKADAQGEAEKLVREKLKKGYREVTSGEAAPAKPATAKADKPAKADSASNAREAVWRNPTDRDALRVWADELAAAGDPRGEFMQLRLLESPTNAQSEKAAALEKKLGGKLTGAARPFLDYWTFDSYGLVSMVHCDGHKLFDGWEHILALSPRLTVCWTTLRKQTMATAQKVAQLPLHQLYFLRIESGLTDRALAAIAPALKGLRHFSIASTDVTPAGLDAVASSLTELEFLCLAPPVSRLNDTTMCNEFVDVLVKNPAFHKLRAVHFFRHGFPDAEHRAKLERLPSKPHYIDSFSPPIEADVIESWMRGET